MMASNTPIEVYAPADIVQARLLSLQLDAAGIAHRIVNEGLSNVTGEVPFTKTGPLIWVAAQHETAARDICHRFDERLRMRKTHVTRGTLFCYYCGETIDEQTDTCPACRRQLE